MAAAAFTACKKTDEPKLAITTDSRSVEMSEMGDKGKIAFDVLGDTIELNVNRNRDGWDYTINAYWCHAIRKNRGQTLKLSVPKNDSTFRMTGNLKIFSGARQQIEFELSQPAGEGVTPP